MIELEINGQKKKFSVTINCVQDLLDSLNITSQGRVIELNNTILNNNDLANIPLKDHDSLEIIQFMGGG